MGKTDQIKPGQALATGSSAFRARSRLLALMVIAAIAASAGVVQTFQTRPPSLIVLTSGPATP